MNPLRLALEVRNLAFTTRCVCGAPVLAGQQTVLVLYSGDEMIEAVCERCANQFEATE